MPPCNSGERPLYSVARTVTVPNNPSSGEKIGVLRDYKPLLQVGVVDEQDRKISEFDHALGKICDSAVVFDADNLYLAALLRILKEELDDKADTIEWWLYEDVRKCIWFDLEDGRRMRYDMPTAESLYNYLTLPFEQLPLEVES